jgi:anti-sigma-K factor RskA
VSLGPPASRPGAGLTRRPTWHWLIAAVAVAVVAGGLVLRPWSRTSPAVPTVKALDGTTVVGGEVGRWFPVL